MGTTPTTAQEPYVYFISDDSPINNFEFLRPLCSARDCDYPSLVLPVWLFKGVAFLLERIYLLSKSYGIPIEPFLTQAEVFKVGITHYFSMEKAKRELGYCPTISSLKGAERMADRYRYQESNPQQRTTALRAFNYNYFRIPAWYWWISISLGMGLLGLFAWEKTPSCSTPTTLCSVVSGIRQVAYFLFRRQEVLKAVFGAAVLTHAIEAGIAYRSATNLQCSPLNTSLWTMQTFLLGYPSLQYLHRRQRFVSKHFSAPN